jgi:CelD/BcsL family acetyltransferase involved in cellulose biosynthesis
MRRLGETGEVEFVEDADGGSPDSFEDCLKLEESGWKGHAGSAMLSSTETAGFYRELVELARDQGWLRLSVLTLDGQMTAFELNLEYGGRLHVLKVGYDETLKKASPGNLLSFAVLKAAADRGLETAEWGGEADEYKLRWTDLDRMRVTGLQFGAAGGARLLGMPLRVAARFRGVSARS